MRFTKMHGIGNDYIYVNCFEEQIENPEKLAVILSDRHRGIGADGLILIMPSEKADVRMRIFNADGSEAEMCGNGIRCVAKYVFDHNVVEKGSPLSVPSQDEPFEGSLKIETLNGIRTVGINTGPGGQAENICVNMGTPETSPERVPINLPGENVIEQPIEVLGEEMLVTAVSMGNPHAVFFCEDIEKIDLDRIGPAVENHSLFPNRSNVHFVQVTDAENFTMRTWERGSGITLACGTGACGCAVAAVLTGRCNRLCNAYLPGGKLHLNWARKDNCVYMTGPAEEVFTGNWPDERT